MLIVRCPHCGDRPEVEFRYAGEAHIVRPPSPLGADDETWSAYLYERSNVRGPYAERWRHLACGRFFNALRDTVTDRFWESSPAGSPGPVKGGAGQ